MKDRTLELSRRERVAAALATGPAARAGSFALDSATIARLLAAHFWTRMRGRGHSSAA